MSLLDSENSIELIRGSTRVFALLLTEDSGAPVNLTGARILLTVKGSPSDSSVKLVKDSARGGSPPGAEVVDALGGEARVTFFPADTHDWDPGAYVFDLWVVLASGARHPVVPQSELQVLPSITRIPL